MRGSILLLLLNALFLMGCTNPNPGNVIMNTTAADMMPQQVLHMDMDIVGSNDMGTTKTDMINVSAADMTKPVDIPDMMPARTDMVNPCPGGDIFCNGFCVNPATNNNNCGGCGIVCTGNQMCKNSACLYQHTDTFCSDTWTDSNAAVDATNPATAALACAACYNTTAGQVSGCLQKTGVDSVGNSYSFYYFVTAPSTTYRFFYHDDTGQMRVGKADEVTPSIEFGLNTWSQ